ncbi:MAG TPA: DciA family protein [Candidatus Brocadiia bacterium]|nr:DciA family protein [Candidatus Brocadiia bacterium]
MKDLRAYGIPAGGGGARRIGDLARDYLEGVGKGPQRNLNRIRRVWESLTTGGGATSVRSFQKGVATIEVSSSALLYELANYEREQLLASLQKELPGCHIRKLEFKLSSGGV